MNDFFDQERAAGTNRSGARVECRTCMGDRFVTVRLRSPEQTVWMQEHGIRPPREPQFHEEVSPCPDCNSGLDVDFWRHDGTRFRGLDTAAVREALSR